MIMRKQIDMFRIVVLEVSSLISFMVNGIGEMANMLYTCLGLYA